jgi:hypothetical protein
MPGATNSSTDSSPDAVRSAKPKRAFTFTTSASSLTSTDLAAVRDPRGCSSWLGGAANRLWAVAAATEKSTLGGPPRLSGSDKVLGN